MAAVNEIEAGAIVAEKYRVDRVIGIGGMGFVVAATHLQLEQKLALKFLRNESLGNAEVVQRFLREARASVRLRGEHVARVYDVGVHDDGRPFMVMEYLEGDDLSTLLKMRGPLPVEETVDYMLQACEALAEAHALGIIHRDLKPANLFLTRTPAGIPLVKVLDFGISKANPLGDAGTSAPSITSSASMLGSPGYMAPEQMRSSRDVDVRSDIWSIGIILFRLTSGSIPFQGDTLGDLLHRVMNDPTPSLRVLCPSMPAGFEHVVEKCLMKDRCERFANLAALAAALAPYASESSRFSAQRVAMVLGGAGSRPSMPSGTPAAPAVSITPPTTNGTGTTKGGWTGAPSDKRRLSRASTAIAGGAMAATLVGAGLVFGALVVRSRSPVSSDVNLTRMTPDSSPVSLGRQVEETKKAVDETKHTEENKAASVVLPSATALALVPQVPQVPQVEGRSPAPSRRAGASSGGESSASGGRVRAKSLPSASPSSSVVAPDIPSTRE